MSSDHLNLTRVGSLIKTISSSHNLLIISHQATLRCLLALLLDFPLAELPYLKVPLHTVIKLSLEEDHWEVEHHRLPVDCVDTSDPDLPTVISAGTLRKPALLFPSIYRAER